MKRLSILAAGLSIFALGCGSSSPTASTANPTTVKFTAALLPANEVPPVTNAEINGSGNAVITFNLTRDGSGNITAATADFAVQLAGYPPSTPVVAAHIHNGPAGVSAGVLVGSGITAGDGIVLANGSGSFTRTGITQNMDPAHVNDMIANPANYYFNVHSASNPSGFSRGQMVKQ
jgi:hypothetical protein